MKKHWGNQPPFMLVTYRSIPLRNNCMNCLESVVISNESLWVSIINIILLVDFVSLSEYQLYQNRKCIKTEQFRFNNWVFLLSSSFSTWITFVSLKEEKVSKTRFTSNSHSIWFHSQRLLSSLSSNRIFSTIHVYIICIHFLKHFSHNFSYFLILFLIFILFNISLHLIFHSI